jgi:hypothetical protein
MVNSYVLGAALPINKYAKNAERAGAKAITDSVLDVESKKNLSA